ncbi:hypothetical protein DFQ28_011490 [Apophysomyces sp. BC1034]|nr:hypothetical protein DFQ30_011387 [Apophysomyces sp. BC1015]KAG0168973.1 hypothetical protein DFQ29_009936 [Apophysomyces sp. BC1021]KAG0184261.1 hypothetical protein DFQ28_011490 [Apophysomyces sp. BC1034]
MATLRSLRQGFESAYALKRISTTKTIQQWRPFSMLRNSALRENSFKGMLLRNAGETPQFSTNPTVEAMRRVKTQFKYVAKVTGLTVLSITAATALAWQSYHLYIEFCLESTPSELGYKARNLLHGAHVREKVSPDFDMAVLYLREVLRIALEEQHLDESSATLINLRLRLADDETRAGNLFDAIAEYTRAWKLLSQANTEGGDILLAQTAKKIGDLYTRVADYEKAEEFLAWTLHSMSQQQQDDSTEFERLKVVTTCSLASLYAMQHNFKLALPLFLRALKAISDIENASESSANTEWVCLKAIVQNQLSEVMYGMDRSEEALGWAQASLESCVSGVEQKSKKDSKDCRECRSVASNNLGRLLELKGEFDQALNYFRQAQLYASENDDAAGSVQYTKNVDRVEKIIASKQKAETVSV